MSDNFLFQKMKNERNLTHVQPRMWQIFCALGVKWHTMGSAMAIRVCIKLVPQGSHDNEIIDIEDDGRLDIPL